MAKKDISQFDYQSVAKLEVATWRAYYDHRFFKLFVLLFKLLGTQLQFNWYLTFKLAFYSAFAAADYRINRGHENYERDLKKLVSFYRIISSHATKPFDYKKAAQLEFEWWDIHRYPNKYKKTLEQGLAEATAEVYGVNPENLKQYAKYRAEAMMIPNHKGDKQETKPDWRQAELLLIKSWYSAHKAVQNK